MTQTLDYSSQGTDRLFYEPIIEDGWATGLEEFSEKEFQPTQGNILVVVPPSITRTKGGLDLPDVSHQKQLIARVAAIPPDEDCPVEPGHWVLYQKEAGMEVPFSGRRDLLLLQYCRGPESEILGFFKDAPLQPPL